MSVSIASFNLGLLIDEQSILHRLEFIVPGFAQLLDPNIDRIIHARGPVTIISIVSVVWSASPVFFAQPDLV